MITGTSSEDGSNQGNLI